MKQRRGKKDSPIRITDNSWVVSFVSLVRPHPLATIFLLFSLKARYFYFFLNKESTGK